MAEGSKVTKIRIEFANGQIMGADGDEAELIWRWWLCAEQMSIIHGGTFKGKGLAVLEAGVESM